MDQSIKTFFQNKKITVMGLGLLGRGIGVVKFLAKNGADLIVTDLKTKEQLSSSLKKLAVFKNIKYVCLLYTSPSPRDRTRSRMPSSA